VTDVPARRYKGRTADHPEPWEEGFLTHYAEFGGITLSAKLVGMTVPRVKARVEESPQFAARFDEAKELLADSHEKLLVQMAQGKIKSTGFLALISRLKAERPAKYHDKLQVSGAVAHLHTPIPPAEVEALMRAMLNDAAPETRAAIRGEVTVIEAAEFTPVEAPAK
jgi:hypothetical protein